jgi:ZIP family zinc transporter
MLVSVVGGGLCGPCRSARIAIQPLLLSISAPMTAVLVSFAAFAMTLLGGAVALRFKDRLHLILGFSAGAVIGVAFFDLLPEALSLAAPAYAVPAVLAVVAGGFVAYMVLDRALSPATPAAAEPAAWSRGALGAASLSVHSFMDGFAIGLGFKVSAPVGLIVAAAVLVHDFSDGINTVGVVLGARGGDRAARRWLLVDAAAPVLGVACTLLLDFPPQTLGLTLALFAGFFIYMSASELLPESYHDHPTALTTGMTVLGVLVLYLVTRLAQS